MEELDEKDTELIKEAELAIKKIPDIKWRQFSLSCIGAAVRTKDGKIYSGPNISHPHAGQSSVCAEYSALTKAYSEGHGEIDSIVAFFHDGNRKSRVLAPCGKCREFLRLFGNPWVILEVEGKLKKLRLAEIHPYADNW